jgi:type II secretory pathway pseudopilin PulG
VLLLIVLIVFGVAVIAVASVVLLRPSRATKARRVEDLDSERDVYERLYGRRSMTVSAPAPVERPPEADVDSPKTGRSE